MGSFTSAPKIIPSADADDHDAEYCADGDREDAEACLDRCARHLRGLPAPINREWRDAGGNKVEEEEEEEEEGGEKEESFRVLQWNVLSQGKYYILISCKVDF